MVARIAPQKDFETFARMVKRVVAARSDVRFLVIGDYSKSQSNLDYFEHVEKVISELGVESYVTFTGFRQDVSRFWQILDLFVLTTHFEAMPQSIFEAMAHSKPVLATAVDGIPELVVHETTGLLHEEGDDERVAAQILALLDQRSVCVWPAVVSRNHPLRWPVAIVLVVDHDHER